MELSRIIVFFNEAGQLLLVQPAYKNTREVPGGVVERNESPRSAALREVREELGLTIGPEALSLVAMDYMAGKNLKTEALMFLFNGGLLTPQQQSDIRLPSEELLSSRFVEPATARQLLGPVLGGRVLRGLTAISSNTVAYFEGSY